MEIAGWLQRLLPKVESYGWEDGCWAAHVKMRTPEHHPPLYWLGRALDAVEELGALDRLRSRLLAAHGPQICEGWSEQDQSLQDALSEACALAWAAEHLGAPQFADLDGTDRLLVHVPSVDAYIAPRRLHPERTIEALFQQVGSHAADAAGELPDARGRLLYVDFNLALDAYARDVGYDGPLTEPVREWMKFHSTEHQLGWILTRPFEWGVPIEVWF